LAQTSVRRSGLPVSANDVSAGTVDDGTICTSQPYPCVIKKLETAVTTADEAQSISVIDTSPQSADADVAPNESAIAAVAANIFILIIVSLFNLWPDMWLLWSTAFGSVCVAAKQKKAIPTPMMELY
jgi:hypothetical protein